MIAKTNEALALSDNLGTEGGAFRYIGTRYHFNFRDHQAHACARCTTSPPLTRSTLS
jgi:hypothetical protein